MLADEHPRSRRRESLASLFALTAVAIACQPDPDSPDAQSEYVDLYLHDGIEVCAGQLDAYDRYIERVFQMWTGDDPGDFRAELHAIVADADLRAELCISDADGCVKHGVAWMFSGNDWIGYHELTHVITNTIDGRTAPALEEGVADGFAGPAGGGVYEAEQREFLFASSAQDLSASGYSIAAAFFRFVADRHGMPAFREYYRSMREDRTRERFESEFLRIFGETYADAWTVFIAAPRCAYELPWCGTETPHQEIVVDREIDCTDPNTLGFSSDNVAFRPVLRFAYEKVGSAPTQVESENVATSVALCEPYADMWMGGFGGAEPESWPWEMAPGIYGVYMSPSADGDVHLSMTQ